MAPVIYRYEVPIDDQWHEISLQGKILPTLGSRKPFKVEFWALADDSDDIGIPRSFRVFGTGYPLPSGTTPEMLHGSVIGGGGMYVWHLVERR